MIAKMALGLTLLIGTLAQGQNAPKIEEESWSDKPVLQQIDKAYATTSAIILLDTRKIEFVDDAKGNVLCYKTLHKLVHINDDQGIEAFNKVYLPVADNADIVAVKARTILPDGKVIELDKSNIKDLKEGERLYKIFAVDGLQKGCEVEYYYTYNANINYFGNELMQTVLPVVKSSFTIISPVRLSFEMKVYNNSARATDTILADKRWVQTNLPVLPAAENEKSAFKTANMTRVEFRLSYNAAKSKSERLFTWDELAKRLYNNYSGFSSKEEKRAAELVAEKKWDLLANDTAKIAAVEGYIKENIGTREDISGANTEEIDKILVNKIASHRGIIRLFSVLYNKLGIELQFVLTGDRADYVIDKKFENWNNCKNALLYFPRLKKFLAPTEATLRFPWVEPNWGNTVAVFCKGTVIGNFSTAVAEVKQVLLEDYSESSSNVEADLSLNTTADTLLINCKQLYRGYAAQYFRAVFNLASEENQRKYIKEVVKFGTNSENIVSSSLENKDFASYTANKPFVLQAVVKSGELVEKAGDKVLVKIGEIIGPQTEMYQEKVRQFPIEIPFAHVLERRIQFTIPNGYIVKNAASLSIEHVFKDNGQITMGFVSGYTQKDNIINIHIVEEYRKTYYPIAQYEDYKKVINAAADFNKVVLVLEKTK